MQRKTIRIAQPWVGREERSNVLAVLRSGQLASGEWVTRFEERFAARHGCRGAVATSSGTTALHAALLALGVRPGDRVVTTPLTFIASGNAIVFCGARPVFCDVDPVTLNLDPSALARILARTKARVVLPVHLYGLPCDMPTIVRLARRHGAKVLEDCAQAAGASIGRRPVGSFGDAAAFSFYATKNMMTGEGGMVTARDPAVLASVRKLVNHGRRLQYAHDAIGYNYRMTNLAAAIGLAQLSRLDRMNAERRRNAAVYDRAFAPLRWLTRPARARGREHVFHLYTVRLSRRDALAAHLKARGVDASIAYPTILPEQEAYRRFHDRPRAFPVALAASRQVLSLPVHPRLTRADLSRVISAVQGFPKAPSEPPAMSGRVERRP